jgi:hypothetical protein
MAKYLIVGYRPTMKPTDREELAYAIGLFAPDFIYSCQRRYFPVGTIAQSEGRWYEVREVREDKETICRPVEIPEPAPGEIIRRASAAAVDTRPLYQTKPARQLALF